MRNGRRAVAVSAGVHALALIAVVAAARRPTGTPEPPTRPQIDTRVAVRSDPISRPEPTPILTPPVQDRPPEPRPEPEPPAPTEPPPPASAPVTPSPPAPAAPPSASPPPPPAPPLARAVAVPAVLPPELLARVRGAVSTTPTVDPALRPVAAVEARPQRPAARPVHGALAAGQRVVYLLDGSGSMGEWGRFDAARGAVAATLALQPAAARARVVVYAGTAEAVGPLGWVGPDGAAGLSAALAGHNPAGRGDHLAGIRAALEPVPDFVVWFTDADDLPVTAIRAQVRRAGGRVIVVVVRVGVNGVEAPVELR